MNRTVFIFGLLAVVLAGTAALAEPSDRSATRDFAAQSSRPRITIYPRHVQPGPASKRHCRAWLAKEYRVSGPVIVPRQHCYWD
jgi:hypothetical protein